MAGFYNYQYLLQDAIQNIWDKFLKLQKLIIEIRSSVGIFCYICLALYSNFAVGRIPPPTIVVVNFVRLEPQQPQSGVVESIPP